MSAEKILIIEDEPELAEILRDYLQAEGFHPYLAVDLPEPELPMMTVKSSWNISRLRLRMA